MPFSLIPDLLLTHYAEATPELLRRRGISLLLCDLDYTLAPRSVSAPDTALRHWLASLEAAGVQVMILSNNRSPQRVEARRQTRPTGLSGGHGHCRGVGSGDGYAGRQAAD